MHFYRPWGSWVRKGTRLTCSHLDWTSLVKKNLVFSKKISLYQESRMILLFQERERKPTALVCLEHNKPSRVINIFFVLTVFYHFLQLHPQHCNCLLVRDQSGQSWAGMMGLSCPLSSQSEHKIPLLLPTSNASNAIIHCTSHTWT